MLNTESFTKYQKWKNQLKFRENEIDFEKVMAIDIIRIAYNIDVSWAKACHGFFCRFNTDSLLLGLKSRKHLFIGQNERGELQLFLELIRKQIVDHSYVQLNPPKISFIDLLIAISSINFVIKNLRKEISFKHSLFLAAQLTYYRSTAKRILPEIKLSGVNIKSLVSFHCQMPLESLVVQMCNNHQIATHTLTHGISYTDFKNFIPLDAINGENITTDKVLVWGDANKIELIKNYDIEPSSIYVCGNPLYPHKEMQIKQSFKRGIVFLGRKVYESSNRKILHLLEQLKKEGEIDFYVRLHPSLSRSFYEEFCKELNLRLVDDNISLKQLLSSDDYDFAIVNNSTAYFEAMYYNLICFRYEPSENELYNGNDDKFDSLSSLKKKIKIHRELESESLNAQIGNILVNNLGMGINTYRKVIDEYTSSKLSSN